MVYYQNVFLMIYQLTLELLTIFLKQKLATT